jgi:hypothetical protein
MSLHELSFKYPLARVVVSAGIVIISLIGNLRDAE